jgi:hypothetical protein
MMPLRSRSISAPSPLLRASLPLCPASVLGLLRYWPLELLPSHRDDRFSRSSPKPDPRSRRLYAGHQVGSNQASPHSHHADHSICTFGTSFVISTRHRRFTFVRLRGSHLTRLARLFHQRSLPRLFTPAACGGLRPAPVAGPGGPTPIFGKAPSLVRATSFLRRWELRS